MTSKQVVITALKTVVGGKKPFIIYDWAGNEPFQGKTFKDFDDAEEFLSEHLGDDYETDREEYYIERER